MPQKKETTRTTEKKTGVKVQDIAPKKDAKGGGGKLSANAPSRKAAMIKGQG
jgi:hypothetical protein